MRADIPKFIKALSYYLFYYAKVFPFYFALQVIGVCSGFVSATAFLGLLVVSENLLSIFVFGAFLALPLLLNGLMFVRFYRQFGVDRGEDSQNYLLDSTFINTLIEQCGQYETPDMGGCKFLIFETAQIGAPLKHLAVWSPKVNRELFFSDATVCRWRFSVNHSLKWSRLKAICRDWRARRALLMFYIFDGLGRGKIVSDDQKIGLSDTLVPGTGEVSLEVFPISFFDSLLTNGAAGRVLVGPFPWESFDFRGFFPIKGNGHTLMELSDSHELANYIGVSTLLISGNHQKYLYIPRQSQLNQQSSGLLAPSGSGSLDWKDLSGAVAHDDTAMTYSLQETVIKGMERELREELEHSVDFDLKNSELQTQIIGYFRMYERAGKPEFVGISVACGIGAQSLNRQQIIEVHSVEKFSFSSIGELKSLCERLLEKRFELSVPLRMSLLFLCMAIEDDEGKSRLNEKLR